MAITIPPALRARLAHARRLAPLPWILGLIALVASPESSRSWVGAVSFFLCVVSGALGVAGLVALIFYEDERGEKEVDPLGTALAMVGVLGAFIGALAAMLITPSE